jgi:hypothetical protein
MRPPALQKVWRSSQGTGPSGAHTAGADTARGDKPHLSNRLTVTVRKRCEFYGLFDLLLLLQIFDFAPLLFDLALLRFNLALGLLSLRLLIL